MVNCVQFLPDSSCVASGSADRTIKMWDIRSRQLIQVYNDQATYLPTILNFYLLAFFLYLFISFCFYILQIVMTCIVTVTLLFHHFYAVKIIDTITKKLFVCFMFDSTTELTRTVSQVYLCTMYVPSSYLLYLNIETTFFFFFLSILY